MGDCVQEPVKTPGEGFTIITALSPDYAKAMEYFIPSWFANSGADEIVIHRIDEGSWAKNAVRRGEIVLREVRGRSGSRVLMLDADCMVLGNLSGGFTDQPLAMARWPRPNIGVTFINLATDFPVCDWLAEVVDATKQSLGVDTEPESGYCIDQRAWHLKLAEIEEHVTKLDENVWNYNRLGLGQWRKDLPAIKDDVKILHFKYHGKWPVDCIDYAKELFSDA